MKHTPLWQPNYTITPATASGLMEIEAARAVVAQVSLPVAVQAELRRRARVRSTHYSTRIEGNRLTLQEAQEVIDERRTTFHGRERDVAEVRNYWNALLRVEEWATNKTPMTEKLIQRLHALVEHVCACQTNSLSRWSECDPGFRFRRNRLHATRCKGCAAPYGYHGGLG